MFHRFNALRIINNLLTARQYFIIDDYLSGKMAWVLASNSIAHLTHSAPLLID